MKKFSRGGGYGDEVEALVGDVDEVGTGVEEIVAVWSLSVFAPQDTLEDESWKATRKLQYPEAADRAASPIRRMPGCIPHQDSIRLKTSTMSSRAVLHSSTILPAILQNYAGRSGSAVRFSAYQSLTLVVWVQGPLVHLLAGGQSPHPQSGTRFGRSTFYASFHAAAAVKGGPQQ